MDGTFLSFLPKNLLVLKSLIGDRVTESALKDAGKLKLPCIIMINIIMHIFFFLKSDITKNKLVLNWGGVYCNLS